MDPSDVGDPIYWETLGTAPNRRFVVQYKVSHIDVSAEPLDFEVILFEGSNEIKFQYGDATLSDSGLSNGKSATVGIQGIDTVGVNYQANEGVLSDSLAILFSPQSGSFVGINASVKLGNPGTDLTHTVSVFNRTGLGQDFAIELMPGSRWATTAPASTGLIADGTSATFDLTVMIPGLNDLPPLVDLAAIRLTGGGVSAVQNIITKSLPGRQLTNDAVRSSFDPSLSGDGSRVAFYSQADHTGGNPSFKDQIFVINTNGTGLTQLTDDVLRPSRRPSLSVDGSRVAFQSNADHTGGNPSFQNQIFVINTNGTGLEQLTSDAVRGSFAPSLSGDGSRVAFYSSADHTGGGNPSFKNQIFVINTNGTGLTQLTDDAVLSSFNPSLSGDGSRVAFRSPADHTGGNPSFKDQIFVINTNGGGLTQLTDDVLRPSFAPSLSGDGSRVAFYSRADHSGGNPSFQNQIFVINTNGGGLIQLTNDAVNGSTRPRLSGDGSRVAFNSSNRSLAVMNTDGTGGRLDFRDIPSSRTPSLSTDGGFLAYTGIGENDTRQIYFIEAAKADSDKDGVLNSLEGSSADNAAAVLGLSLNTGGTVDITLPAGQRLAAVASSPAVGGPFDVPFPFGTVSYHTTSVIGGSTTASLTFSSPLPDPLNLYKVDFAGVFTEIPTALWTKTGPNSLNITLTDGGAFDLDGVENGVIIDPIAVGNPPAPAPFVNTVPTAPNLLFPDNGVADVGADATFVWEASTDADGNALTYSFFICENAEFTGAACEGTSIVASLKTGLAYAAVFGGSASGLFLIGMVFTGRITRNKPGLLMIGLLVTGLLFTAGCSSGGDSAGTTTLEDDGTGETIPTGITHQVSALAPGTTYFWKVVVSDGTDSATSEVRSFTTQ